MTRRRQALQAIAACVLVPSFPSRAAAPSRPRVAIQNISGWKGRDRWRAHFAEEGLVDGRDVDLEFVRLGGEPAVTEPRARALVASRPRVIVVPGGELIGLFKGLTRDIPIVFYSFGQNPVHHGFVDSYSRPGGNVTGTTNQGAEVVPLGWQLLSRMRPGARRVGSLMDEEMLASPWAPVVRETWRRAAVSLGLEQVEIVVRGDAGFAPVQEAIRRARIDLLAVGTYAPWLPELMAFVEKEAIPALWVTVKMVEAGGLMSVLGSFDEAMRASVSIVASILRGREPGTIPVREVTGIDIAINLRTARAMKLAIPPDILLRANRVFE
ncbi:MAG TPA: ABC transporter substrate-binding protein [Usitatibacter sp.]|nr:ABC transporter substrate-binding protein [Usitatibacter sp.]